MKEKVSQMFKDKLFLVMLVLGLLTIVAAAGVVTIQRGNKPEEGNPYLEVPGDGGIIAESETSETKALVAGPSNAQEETGEEKEYDGTKAVVQGAIDEPIAQVGAGNDAAKPLVLNFTDTSRITWPTQGNVLLAYSMDRTIYFPTLDQYKCNSGVVIQSDVSEPVHAPANARVMELGSNEEIGNYIVLDLGNDYTAVCGQLKEIPLVENEYLEKGDIMGYVAEPTKYYSVEGTNVFFQLKHQNQAIDPLDYLE